MSKDKSTGKKLADMMYGSGEMRATPQSRITGPVANAVRRAQQFANQYEIDPRIPLLGGTSIDELLSLPDAASLLEDVSYNGMGALVRGGNAATGGIGTFRPDPRILSATDVALTATGVGKLGTSAARAAPGAIKAAARNLSTPNTLNPQAGVIKPRGGNFLGGRLMGNMDESVSRLRPYRMAGDDGTFLQKDLRSAKYRLEILESDPYKNDAMVAGQKRTIEDIEKKIAINNWVTNNLGKYTKNQMATPEDPIRLLLDKRTKEVDTKHAKDMERAERVSKRAMDEPDSRRQANLIRESERLKLEANVERQFAMDSIIPSRMQDYPPEADYYLKQRRQEAGFPAEGMGESEAAKRYETLTDDAISTMRAGDVQDATKLNEEIRKAEDEFKTYRLDMSKRFDQRLSNAGLSDKDRSVLNEKTRDKEKARILDDGKYDELMVGLNKLDKNFELKDFQTGQENPFIAKLDPETTLYSGNTADMGFDHVIDILKQDVMEGRIRPEQLNKVSVEDAVRRTMEVDQEAARKMAETQIKATEGFPVVKEYPEGFRWIELAPRNVEELRAVHADFVRKDFPDLEGADPTKFANYVEDSMTSASNIDQKKLADALKYEGDTMGHCVGGYCPDVVSGKSRIFSLRDAKGEPHVTVEVSPEADYDKAAELLGIDDPTQGDIARLVAEGKLPGTEKIVQIKGKQNARPIEKYDKYTQDFVKSGTYSSVGDLENTGLIKHDSGKFISKAEMDALSRKHFGETMGNKPDASESPEQYFRRMSRYDPEYLSDIDKAFVEDWRAGNFPSPDEGMARGGSVHISNDPDVMTLELAKGGLVKKLARLARAPAKSKQEIDAIAERLAPQVTGEYVRESPKSAKTVAGKTQKQFQREKTLPVDVRPTGEERVPELVDIEKLKGDVMIGVPGDPTLTGKTLFGVGDVRLGSPSPQHGGPLYGLYSDDAFWASGLGAARGVQNLAKRAGDQYDAPVKGNYVMMGPDSSNYAQHFADANLQAIDLSKMTKKQIDQFNELIRKGSKKSGPRKSFPGIEDKGEAYMHMAMDSDLRKHFNALMQQNTLTEKLNLPNGNDIRFAITEPALRDLETGVTGFSMGKMRPDIASKNLPMSTHPTYDYVIPGEFMGQSRFPMPYELSFPDTLQSVRANPKQASQEFGSFKYVGPRQIVDQQMVDEIKMYEERMKQLTGKKAGGEVKAPAAQIDGNKFVLAAQRYGLGDDMTTLNKMVSLVNRGATVDEAAKIVASTSRKGEQQVQVSARSQEKSEQRVQNPVHFTENPDAMRLALSKRN